MYQLTIPLFLVFRIYFKKYKIVKDLTVDIVRIIYESLKLKNISITTIKIKTINKEIDDI